MDVAETKRWATGISSNSGCSVDWGGPLLGATDGAAYNRPSSSNGGRLQLRRASVERRRRIWGGAAPVGGGSWAGERGPDIRRRGWWP